MKKSVQVKTIRRSVALPSALVSEALKTAESRAGYGHNFNRVVATALKEFIEHGRQTEFEQAMAQMAADPAVKTENQQIAGEFKAADMDGLKEHKAVD